MKNLSKFLMLSLAVLAVGCKPNPRSESGVQKVSKNQEEQMVQEEISQEHIESNVVQNETE